jgi:hypothetical protein
VPGTTASTRPTGTISRLPPPPKATVSPYNGTSARMIRSVMLQYAVPE